jgi:hypothetical protein
MAAPSYDSIDPLVEPYSYLIQVPGKEVRSQLIDAFNMYASQFLFLCDSKQLAASE